MTRGYIQNKWKILSKKKGIYQEPFGDPKFPTSHSYLESLTWGRLISFDMIWFDLVSKLLNGSRWWCWLGQVGVCTVMMFELPGGSPVPLSHQGEARLSQEHAWASGKFSPEKERSSIGARRCKGSQAVPVFVGCKSHEQVTLVTLYAGARSLQKLSFPELLRHLWECCQTGA